MRVVDGRKSELEDDKSISENPALFDLAWDEYRDFIGMSRKHKAPKAKPSKVGKRRKLAVISDTHGRPFTKGLVQMTEEKPDMVLIVGDVCDLMAVSKFDKDIVVPIEEDMANVRAMVEFLASKCPVYLARGNHDSRVWRYFVRRIEPQYMKLVWTDILGMSIQGIDNAHVVDNLHGFTTTDGNKFEDILKTSFLIFEGDAVFGHAEAARKHELTTVRALHEWYENWRRPMGWPDVRLIGQAHVHGAAVGYPHAGHLVTMELGCMLEPSVLQYTMMGDLRYRPPVIGYSIIEQGRVGKDWKTDLSSVRFVPC